jgi:alanine-glyoxylate transaminase/serine-glyoxylate transaminase/serine-pyruvate transaminase
LTQFNLEIGAGLGGLAGRVWRIGLMGAASNVKNIVYCLSAIESTLAQAGARVQTGAAVQAALDALSAD